jgi:acyl-coenzyme A synthetase/AMP-(fatty) acid ligase
MTGPQLTLGYYKDAEKTAAAFIVPPGKDRTYYRTGDRVRKPIGDKPLIYLGRMDYQIKILGHRVELGEIEAALREAAGVDAAIAAGWPMTASGADGIVAFLGAERADVEAIRDQLKDRLPPYMVPREFHLVPNMPLNSNGKIDRKALIASLGK